jgi:hypothetical protein
MFRARSMGPRGSSEIMRQIKEMRRGVRLAGLGPGAFLYELGDGGPELGDAEA